LCRKTARNAKMNVTETKTATKATTPSGMPDCNALTIEARSELVDTIIKYARTYGVDRIETPILELSSLVIGEEHGDIRNQVYHVDENNLYTLRYDLTKPFARYMAQNGLSQFSRVQAGPVFRKDTPAVTNGRFCQFWQCDVDFAGKTHAMLYDWQCIELVISVLQSVALDFRIRVNHRELFEYLLLEKCKLPKELYLKTAQIIDKSDKMSKPEILVELSKIGIATGTINAIEQYLFDDTKDSENFDSDEDYPGCAELQMLFRYQSVLFPNRHYIEFDKTLVRGMHYYTGMIFEVVLVDGGAYGSIAAGGRYDQLIQQMAKSEQIVPVVGVSFGIDRIVAILAKDKQVPTLILSDIFITFVKAKDTSHEQQIALFENVLEVAQLCREPELFHELFRVTVIQDPDMPLKAQIKLAADKGNVAIIIIGEMELTNNSVTVRKLGVKRGGTKIQQETVAICDLMAYLVENF